jgi:hypothetical protein
MSLLQYDVTCVHVVFGSSPGYGMADLKFFCSKIGDSQSFPVTQRHDLVTSPTLQYISNKLNFVAWDRTRTLPTERPPLVGEHSANVCREKVPRGQRDESLWPYFRLSRPQPLLFLPSGSSVVLTRLSGPRYRCTISQKIWLFRESNPGPMVL